MTGDPPLPDKRFFSIRETADLSGVEPHVLRYWEEEFPQLRPRRRGGNRRTYRPEDVRLVRRIRYLLWERKYTIEGARERLSEAEGPESSSAGVTALREVRAELAAILEELDANEAGEAVDRAGGGA
ncbi:MAG: MerR family transcriptional regulator [Thiohalorhabdus sp.]|uniref:MerR family transcriptional regulator n=1 Tax=Thiohalorhabdus sp. TaxID=3094134 RepID=UPI003980D170